MSSRRLAWGLFALYVVLQVATLWVIWDGPNTAEDALGAVVLGYALVGALVASRRPRSPVGWLLLAIAIVFGVNLFGEAYSYYASSTPGYEATLIVSSLAGTVSAVLAGVFLPLVFPDGRLPSSRWRPVVRLAVLGVIASLLGSALRLGTLDDTGGVTGRVVPNPLMVSGSGADVVAAVATTGDVILVIVFLMAAGSLVVRFRRARGAQRQQLKLFGYACVIAICGFGVAAAGGQLPDEGNELMVEVGWFTFLFAMAVGVPLAIGIAILRHGLLDIDVVINRTLVYGLLTAILAASYLGLVLVLRPVLSPATGDSDLAVAASTLAVAALFRPLRHRVQSAVDRRFYRQRYDAQRTMDSFAGRLRDELDLEALGGDLRHVVQQTMQPSHVALWLREADR